LAQADGLIALVNPAVRIMRPPSAGILKESNGADSSINEKIEPVPCARRHTNQVTCLDRDYPARSRVNVIDTPAFHDEPNLVFAVPVLTAELGKHLIQTRRLGRNVNHVRRNVPSALLQSFNLGSVLGQDLSIADCNSDSSGRVKR